MAATFREEILAALDLGRRGLEIGALDRPLVTRDLGPVEYVDHAPTEALRERLVGHRVNLDAIVTVDHVWGEASLVDCVGGDRTFAYVVASHVIEHVPDLFGWLGEIAEVLEDGGLAAFVVPDKRFTFDVQRRTSHWSEFADAYVRRLRRPDPRQVFDHVAFAHADAGRAPAEALTPQRVQEILDQCRRWYEGRIYIDVHCWVFTPFSLIEALDLASRMGVLPFEVERLAPTRPGSLEFLLVLRRLPEGLDGDDQRARFEASVELLSLPPETLEDAEHDSLTAQIAHLRAIEASTTWRLTAPLRAMVTGLRRLGGG